MSALTFSGHETFHCRHFWLKKGIDFLNENRTFSDDMAVVDLGVGKNMVTAIRYWLRAFNLVDENDQPNELARYIFGEKGVDPYLENTGTVWLLHYHLVSVAKASIYSLVFNEFRKERIEFTRELLRGFLKRKCEEAGIAYNENTVSNDIGVFIRTYLRPYKRTKNIEDDFSSAFIDLELMQELARIDGSAGKWLKIEGQEREELPVEIVLFSILDNKGYGQSVSFNELLNGYDSPGAVFALNASGLMKKIEGLVSTFEDITFTDDAGIRELQFKRKPDKWQVLDSYYESN